MPPTDLTCYSMSMCVAVRIESSSFACVEMRVSRLSHLAISCCTSVKVPRARQDRKKYIHVHVFRLGVSECCLLVCTLSRQHVSCAYMRLMCEWYIFTWGGSSHAQNLVTCHAHIVTKLDVAFLPSLYSIAAKIVCMFPWISLKHREKESVL